MLFLYIFECMLFAVLAMAGGTDDPLETTGKMSTSKDVWVGVTGWFVIFAIIATIRLIIYFKTKNNDK